MLAAYYSHPIIFMSSCRFLFLGAGGTEFKDEYLPETVVTCENDTASSNQRAVHCKNLVIHHTKCKFLYSKWDGVMVLCLKLLSSFLPEK